VRTIIFTVTVLNVDRRLDTTFLLRESLVVSLVNKKETPRCDRQSACYRLRRPCMMSSFVNAICMNEFVIVRSASCGVWALFIDGTFELTLLDSCCMRN